MRYAVLVLALAGPLLFPWPLVAVLAVLAAASFPLAPLGVGVIMDAFHYAPGAAGIPLAVAAGLTATLIALAVRQFVKTSIIA